MPLVITFLNKKILVKNFKPNGLNLDFKKNIETHVFSVLMVGVFLIDAVYKAMIINGFRDFRVAAYFKVPILLFSFFFLVYKRRFFVPRTIVILFLMWLCGQLAIGNNSFSSLKLVYFGKYIYPLLLLSCGTCIIKSKEQIEVFKKTFEIIFLLNAVLILIGFLFHVSFFRSYISGSRFGYNGLIMSSSQASYIFIISLLYFLFGVKWYGSYRGGLKLALIVLSGVLIGTKAILMFIVFVITLVAFKLFNKRVAMCAFIGFFVLLMLFLLNLDSFVNFVERTNFITALFSYRNDLLLNNLMPFVLDFWTIPNYLFGGVKDWRTKSELGFVDVFYFFGIIGGVLYLYSYAKTFCIFNKNQYVVLLLISVFVIIALGGNFFYNPSLAIYLIVIQKVILENNKLDFYKNEL